MFLYAFLLSASGFMSRPRNSASSSTWFLENFDWILGIAVAMGTLRLQNSRMALARGGAVFSSSSGTAISESAFFAWEILGTCRSSGVGWELIVTGLGVTGLFRVVYFVLSGRLSYCSFVTSTTG